MRRDINLIQISTAMNVFPLYTCKPTTATPAAASKYPTHTQLQLKYLWHFFLLSPFGLYLCTAAFFLSLGLAVVILLSGPKVPSKRGNPWTREAMQGAGSHRAPSRGTLGVQLSCQQREQLMGLTQEEQSLPCVWQVWWGITLSFPLPDHCNVSAPLSHTVLSHS